MSYGGGLGACLNPPCQTGGVILVNGVRVMLAPDVEVQGTGDDRILRRPGTGWYSVYALPADFILSGPSPDELHAGWQERLSDEWAAAHPEEAAAGATPPPPPIAAGLGLGLPLIVGVGLTIAFLMRKGR